LRNKSLYHLIIKNEEEELSHSPLVFFEGEVNHAVTRSLTMLTENLLTIKAFSRLVVKKVFNIMVECLQNLDKHLDPLPFNEESPTKRASLFLIEKEEVFVIMSANLIEKNAQKSLEKRLSSLVTKSREELRQLYKEQLEKGKISTKGGAGLGFIDMARKSGLPFGYNFINYNDKYTIFIIKFMVTKNRYEKD